MPMRPISNRDFSNRKYYPGEPNTPIEAGLKTSVKLEDIPALVFFLLLVLLAGLITRFKWPMVAILALFFLFDWICLALLPRFNRSFGPPKPSVLLLALMRSLPVFLPLPGIIQILLQCLGCILLIYGFWIEPHRIRVTTQRLLTPKMRVGTRLRILQLGDLHMERITGRERQLNKLVAQLKPDLILFSGDILNLSFLADWVAWESAREVISAWKAPLGTYFVSGSPAVDLPGSLPKLLEGLHVHLLQDEKLTLKIMDEEFDLVGVSCTHRPQTDLPHLKLFNPEPDGRFRILLYHSPDLAPDSASMDFDLYLCGHTHGGQVRLPLYGALVTGSLYGKAFEAGYRDVGGMALYTHRGIGMEGGGAPRVRFLCPPEIVLWEVSGDRSMAPSR